MITVKPGSYTITGSVITVALSLVAVLSVIPYSGHLPDGQIMLKWFCAGIAFCTTIIIQILFACTCTSKDPDMGNDVVDIRTFVIPFFIAFLMVGIHSLLQVTGVVPVNSPNGFHVLAGFDNPAGVASALAVSLPFVLALADRLKDRRIKYAVMCGAFCVVIVILVLARSRVGILAVGVVMLLWSIHAIKDVKTKRIVAAILTVIVVAAVVYMSLHKRGSNSGRALILGVCWDMIRDAPLFGYGLHGFRSHYMLYQADYLERCTSRVLPMLADNTTHPLCEYALLAVNYGLTGITMLLAVITITIRQYLRNKDEESFTGITALAGTAVLSLFSYPFRYPLSVLGVLCALWLVYKDVLLKSGQKLRTMLGAVAVMLSVAGLVFIIPWARAQQEWGRLSAIQDNGGSTKNVMEGYNRLYPRLDKDPYFLYNYAYILSESGDCEKAGKMATGSFGLMANYDTALLIADNAKECGDVDAAEKYYWLASKMCPVRFMPLYGLFCLYKDLDRIDDMFEIGQEILSKPVKISSIEIRTIKSYVKQTLMK